MINIKAIKHASPKDKSVLYYVGPCKIYHVDINAVCADAAKETTVTAADIKSTLDALQRQILRHLYNGDSIRLGDIGSFRVTLKSSKVADYVADVTKLDAAAKAAYEKAVKGAASTIKSIRVRFRCSPAMKDALNIKTGTVKTKMVTA